MKRQFAKIIFSLSMLLFSLPLPLLAATVSGSGGGTGTASSDFRLFPDLSCPDETTALTCWMGRLWTFSQTAILTLSVAAMVFAGVIYMTSRGNPKQVETAKKIIIGALSAVAVMVLGKFFLTRIVGVSWVI